ncbi:uncharacterized protein TNCV_5067241 [Trichonephila clavipes]|nr:uncharacterized protein TNCV_5067241 [Trichonephila clavipes]
MIVGSSGQDMVGSASRRPGSGRLCRTTEREDRGTSRTAVVHRTASSVGIRAADSTAVTQRTVRNLLLQGQLRARRPVACIPLSLSHSRLSFQWCQTRTRWRTEWRSVIFSGESRFCSSLYIYI